MAVNMVKHTIRGFDDTIAWYEDNAVRYAQNIEHFPSVELLDRFARVVGKGKKVLDAGCAAGRDTRFLKDKGLIPIGIDLSKSLITIARAQHPDIEFRHGDFRELPFAEEEFDGIWAHACLLHFETIADVTKALLEFKRVLRVDGVLHISVKQQMGTEKTGVVSDKLSGHRRFFQWFTKEEVKSLVEEAGFRMVDLQDNYGDPSGRSEVKWVLVLARKRLVEGI